VEGTVGLSQRREKLIARLGVPKTRSREGAVLVEGVRAVGEALDAEVDVSFAVVSPRLTDAPAGPALERRLAGVELVRVSEGGLAALSDTERDQGVLLVCREPEASLAVVRAGGRYLVLDGVQDPGNAGTLIRATVAFGLDAVVCLDGTVDPWGPKPVRASAGMIFRVPVVRASAEAALARLREVGVPLYVADTEGEDVDVHPKMPSFAIALGNEGRGPRESLVERADGTLTVSMPGGAESLNVAMAGSILLHSLTRSGPRG
jgi:TrmH family RNA methyltransferase